MQAQTHHEEEFTAAEQNYWKQDDTILGEWHGRLAEKFGLAGAIGAEEFTSSPFAFSSVPDVWRKVGAERADVAHAIAGKNSVVPNMTAEKA